MPPGLSEGNSGAMKENIQGRFTIDMQGRVPVFFYFYDELWTPSVMSFLKGLFQSRLSGLSTVPIYY